MDGEDETVNTDDEPGGTDGIEHPCVRVQREDGEETRQCLDERDLLAADVEIVVDGEDIYLPVTDPGAVPADLAVVRRTLPRRETQTMPADVLGFEPTYERLGDIVILDEDDPERAREVADAVVESALPVQTVLTRASKVKGRERVREFEVLSGDVTETVHREYGCSFALDIAAVYFSPRLATERHRVVEQVRAGEQFLDMFAGVGPFVIPAARRGATAVGVDVNDRAIEYLEANAERNGVADRVTAIHGDVRDLVTSESTGQDAVRDDAGAYENWADRLVMNLPHSADAFLDTAVRLASETCTIHYYDIQHEDDPYGPGEAAVREAAEPEYEVEVLTRRTVRSYAPHERNVCLDVRLSERSL